MVVALRSNSKGLRSPHGLIQSSFHVSTKSKLCCFRGQRLEESLGEIRWEAAQGREDWDLASGPSARGGRGAPKDKHNEESSRALMLDVCLGNCMQFGTKCTLPVSFELCR